MFSDITISVVRQICLPTYCLAIPMLTFTSTIGLIKVILGQVLSGVHFQTFGAANGWDRVIVLKCTPCLAYLSWSLAHSILKIELCQWKLFKWFLTLLIMGNFCILIVCINVWMMFYFVVENYFGQNLNR